MDSRRPAALSLSLGLNLFGVKVSMTDELICVVLMVGVRVLMGLVGFVFSAAWNIVSSPTSTTSTADG